MVTETMGQQDNSIHGNIGFENVKVSDIVHKKTNIQINEILTKNQENKVNDFLDRFVIDLLVNKKVISKTEAKEIDSERLNELILRSAYDFNNLPDILPEENILKGRRILGLMPKFDEKINHSQRSQEINKLSQEMGQYLEKFKIQFPEIVGCILCGSRMDKGKMPAFDSDIDIVLILKDGVKTDNSIEGQKLIQKLKAFTDLNHTSSGFPVSLDGFYSADNFYEKLKSNTDENALVWGWNPEAITYIGDSVDIFNEGQLNILISEQLKSEDMQKRREEKIKEAKNTISTILMDQTVLGEALKQLRLQEHKYGKILYIKTLSGGLTNMVYSVETQGGKYVLKIGEGLDREQEFFAVANNIPLVPKMLEFFTFGNQQAILMEYKSGINGKNAFDKIQDWEYIGKQMGFALRQLHTNIHTKTPEVQDEAIGSVLEYLSWGNKKSDMEKLEKILGDKNIDIVSLHGDFSPHNCLFNQDETGKYEVSAVFDPSGRITKGPAMFDIFYVLSNRWVKDKESFKKGFLEGYGEIDFKSEEYQMLTKVFTIYLEALYSYLESKAT